MAACRAIRNSLFVAGLAVGLGLAAGRADAWNGIDGLWVETDYLMWWTNGSELPPLLVTAPGGTPPEDVGDPDVSRMLYGGSTVNAGLRSGFRLRAGTWIDDCHLWSLDGEFLTLGGLDDGIGRASDGDPILGRPLLDVQANAYSSELVAYPGELTGRYAAAASDYFHSGSLGVRRALCGCSQCCGECDICPYTGRTETGSCDWFCCRTDLLLGYRYFRLGDSLRVREDLLVTQTGPTEGTAIVVVDRFGAKNEFHGPELGLAAQIHSNCWSLDILARLAIGNTRQTVDIDGATTVAPRNGTPDVRTGGVFAVGSNMGRYVRDEFTAIPQLELKLGYQWARCLRTFVGYDLLYWASVAKAAEQYDLYVDPRGVPPVDPLDPPLPFPGFYGRQSSFWAQGASLGMELRY